MAKEVSEIFEKAEEQLLRDSIPSQMIKEFIENPVWKSIVSRMKSSETLFTDMLVNAIEVDEMRKYQQVVYDIRFFLSIPEGLLKAKELEEKEKEQTNGNSN